MSSSPCADGHELRLGVQARDDGFEGLDQPAFGNPAAELGRLLGRGGDALERVQRAGRVVPCVIRALHAEDDRAIDGVGKLPHELQRQVRAVTATDQGDFRVAERQTQVVHVGGALHGVVGGEIDAPRLPAVAALDEQPLHDPADRRDVERRIRRRRWRRVLTGHRRRGAAGATLVEQDDVGDALVEAGFPIGLFRLELLQPGPPGPSRQQEDRRGWRGGL